ncbi:MAG TPA: hypothetical protein VIW46_05585, partial [Acidimicrobiia bacterium]
MRDRIAGRAAGWVWLLTGLVTVASAMASALLFLRETGGSFGDTAWWIIGAGVAIAASGMVAIPAASGNRLTPSYIVIAALPLISSRLYAGDVVIGIDAIFTLQGALSAMFGGLAALAVFRAARGIDQREVAGRFTRRLLVFSTYLLAYDFLVSTEFMFGSDWRRLAILLVAALG